MGMLAQAKFAYGFAGEEGLKKLDDLAKVAISVREKATKKKLPLKAPSPRLPGIGGYLPEQFPPPPAGPAPLKTVVPEGGWSRWSHDTPGECSLSDYEEVALAPK